MICTLKSSFKGSFVDLRGLEFKRQFHNSKNSCHVYDSICCIFGDLSSWKVGGAFESKVAPSLAHPTLVFNVRCGIEIVPP